MKQYTLNELAEHLQAKSYGELSQPITGIAPLDSATTQQITFLDNPRYKKHLATTQAGVVILAEPMRELCPTACLVVANPYVTFAKIAHLFWQLPQAEPGIHPTAVIAEDCKIDASASIGPQCVIEPGVHIGAEAIIGAGSYIGHKSVIGANTRLWPRVTLYHDSQIGARVTLHSGVVIGSDGFGLAKDQGRWVKVPQLGNVIIEDDVEIGANTTIDRAALGSTVIGEDVKLDNQIQIAHGVKIGAHTAVAGCTGIAGSTSIGEHCLVGGSSAINGHIEIADNVALMGGSSVSHSLTEAGVYSSAFAVKPQREWQKTVARFRRLEQLHQRVRKLEKSLAMESEKE